MQTPEDRVISQFSCPNSYSLPPVNLHWPAASQEDLSTLSIDGVFQPFLLRVVSSTSAPDTELMEKVAMWEAKDGG